METKSGMNASYTVIIPAENVFFAFQNATYKKISEYINKTYAYASP